MTLKFFGQLIRYGAVGLFSNLLGYIAYLFLLKIGTDPKIAVTMIYLTSAVAGFWGNKKITFNQQGNFIRTGYRYLIAHAIGYSLNMSIIFVFVDKFKLNPQIVQGIAILIVACVLFFIFKYFVFLKFTESTVRN